MPEKEANSERDRFRQKKRRNGGRAIGAPGGTWENGGCEDSNIFQNSNNDAAKQRYNRQIQLRR
jgi:hypothetical protein